MTEPVTMSVITTPTPSVALAIEAGMPPSGVYGDADVSCAFAFPMPPQQARFWRAYQADPGSGAFNGAFRHELLGPIDPDVIARCWHAMMQRHELLRAVCCDVDGLPSLVIADEATSNMTVTDLRHLPGDKAEGVMDQLCRDEAERPFVLEMGPLIRPGLIRVSDTRSVMTLTLHHMICDGWSVGLLVDEFVALYAAFSIGGASPLAPLEIQFADYAAWLEAGRTAPEATQQRAYWQAALAGYQPTTLQSDYPNDPQDTARRGAIATRILPAELMAGLKAFSDSRGCTLFITTLTALVALLRSATGRHDIAIGTPSAGRNRMDLENVVGPLLNYVILRSAVAGDPTLDALTVALRETVLAAFANQDLRLEDLGAALSGHDTTFDEPGFNISFVCQRAFFGGRNLTFKLGDAIGRTLPSKSQGALFDLTIFVIEREDGWRLSIDYRPDLYSTRRAEALADDFLRILQLLVDAPGAPVSSLQVFAKEPLGISPVQPQTGHATRPAVLPSAAASDAEPGAFVIPASFSQQRFWLLHNAAPESAVFNLPAALRIKGLLQPNVLDQSLQLLMQRHEGLRTTFIQDGDGLQQLIAPSKLLMLRRSTLSLNPGDVLDQQLRAQIIAEGSLPFDLRAGPLVRARVIEIAVDDWLLIITLHHSIADGQSMSILQQELWSIYASVGLGTPPALPPALLQYGDFAAWQRDWLETPDAQAQRNHWVTLLGGPLPVCDFPLDRAPQHRPATRGGIETLKVPPDLLEALRRIARDEQSTLFAVTSAAFAALLFQYGGNPDVLFGFPMANRRIDTQTVIGPFAGPMAMRLDLSGAPRLMDVLQIARNATIESMSNTEYPFELLLEVLSARSVRGRNPLFQFYFIYQTAFLQGRAVDDLVVTPITSQGHGTPYELQLALIERPDGVTAQLEYNPDLLDATTVSTILAQYHIILRAFATDRSQMLSSVPLPAVRPGSYRIVDQRSVERQYVAPRTPIESTLVQIFENLFPNQKIGITDDFFDLGGQSILAARLIGAIAQTFGIQTNVSLVAVARTVEHLAERLSAPEAFKSQRLVPLQTTGRGTPLFLVHCGGGHVLRYRDFVQHAPPDWLIYGLSAPPVDAVLESLTIADLARLYVTEIKAVQPSGPYHIGGYSFGGLVAYEMACQFAEAGETIELLAILDTANPDYYRNVSARERLSMRGIHAFDVVRRYGRNLAAGNFGSIKSGLYETLENRAEMLMRKFRRAIQDVSQSWLAPLVPVETLDIFTRLSRRFVPRIFSGRVVLFFAADRGAEYQNHPTLGWERVAQGGVVVRVVPGTHMTFIKQPNVTTLLEKLIECRRDARQRIRLGGTDQACGAKPELQQSTGHNKALIVAGRQ